MKVFIDFSFQTYFKGQVNMAKSLKSKKRWNIAITSAKEITFLWGVWHTIAKVTAMQFSMKAGDSKKFTSISFSFSFC